MLFFSLFRKKIVIGVWKTKSLSRQYCYQAVRIPDFSRPRPLPSDRAVGCLLSGGTSGGLFFLFFIAPMTLHSTYIQYRQLFGTQLNLLIIVATYISWLNFWLLQCCDSFEFCIFFTVLPFDWRTISGVWVLTSSFHVDCLSPRSSLNKRWITYLRISTLQLSVAALILPPCTHRPPSSLPWKSLSQITSQHFIYVFIDLLQCSCLNLVIATSTCYFVEK